MHKLPGKKYLVTGAAGFIGSHVVEELVKQGKKVVAMDNLVAGKLENLHFLPDTDQVRFANQDVCDLINMEDVDVVFHLAAQPGVRSSWGSDFSIYTKNNIDATQKLLEAAKTSNLKKFIYAYDCSAGPWGSRRHSSKAKRSVMPAM